LKRVRSSLADASTVQVEMAEIPPTYTQDKKICEWSCNAEADSWQLAPKAGMKKSNPMFMTNTILQGGATCESSTAEVMKGQAR